MPIKKTCNFKGFRAAVYKKAKKLAKEQARFFAMARIFASDGIELKAFQNFTYKFQIKGNQEKASVIFNCPFPKSALFQKIFKNF